MADQPTIAIMKTYNVDIVGMVQRLDRVIVEVNRSASGNSAVLSVPDAGRWKGYIADLLSYVDWFSEQPNPLDIPETHPAMLDLEAAPLVSRVDNLVANDIVRLLIVSRLEVVSSQSSSMSSGMLPFDISRFQSIMARIVAGIDRAENAEPVDLPESLPHFPSVMVGNRGIHEPSDGITLQTT